MISLENDYSEGAHPRVLKKLMDRNLEQNAGYGLDAHSQKAAAYIKRDMGREDVDVHFLVGGTQTNMLVISSFLRPFQAVIGADSGHINVHETGAVEGSGHKVLTAPNREGKLTPEGIQAVLDAHGDEHMVQPKMVYVSDTTEYGTVYTKAELEAISRLCRQKGLYLFLDGARLGAAFGSGKNDLTLKDLARLTDVFYIGGTKNGALLGEALVIGKEELKKDFRYCIKNKGALLAKGFVNGLQFEALFEDGLYWELGRHSVKMAMELGEILSRAGVSFYVPVESNQLFPILPMEWIRKLSRDVKMQIQFPAGDGNYVVRLVTSWATRTETVEQFEGLLKRAAGK